MRNDALGLFWEDRPPPPKVKAEKIKKVAPAPVWLKKDYLPGLDEAVRFPMPLMDDNELQCACDKKEVLVFDIESFSNYFIASFRSVQSGKAVFFELHEGCDLDINKLSWVLNNFMTVGFNSLSYDLPITALALSGKSTKILKYATNRIILEGLRSSDVLKEMKVKTLKVNHIDLIEVAPLRASLKIYGGRLHVPRMQDLPFHPDSELTPEQIVIVRWYNINSDLTATAFLYQCLKEHIDLREVLSNERGIDLRSKSDAQIAEAIIADELQRLTGLRPTRPNVDIGTAYRYRVPHFLRFQSALLNHVLTTVANAWFVVDESGSIALPESVKQLCPEINGSVYRMGIGGLHSSETKICHVSDKENILKDRDVTSYYPFIVLLLQLFPKHLGPAFLNVYKSIVDRRLDAKARGDKVVADSLKITINGSFGKLGSKYSILYSPDLLIQVTLTGQLSLLMLIERLEWAGVHVVSANTDGIVIKCPRLREQEADDIISCWEKDTGFSTEEVKYKSLLSKDVNNYIAVKEDGTTKCKGVFSNPWASKKNKADRLHKNPTNIICVEAIEHFLIDNVPIEQTIRRCTDITKFISVRTVKGGAVKVHDADNTEYLGKSIRWYYAQEQRGEIVYALNGNKVPRSDGAKPVMDLPDEFPSDVNYEWYINETELLLKNVGYA